METPLIHHKTSKVGRDVGKVKGRRIICSGETLEDHLIGVSCGTSALFCCAHRPRQQGTSEDVSCNPRCQSWKFVHAVSHKMRLGAKGMTQMGHCRALV